MERFFSPDSLEIVRLELDEWIFPKHKHNYYELILINEGTGVHTLNDVSFKYVKGHVFFLSPEDYHLFQIETTTIFTCVKFTEQIFLEKRNDFNYSSWIEKIIDILKNPNTVPECIIKNKNDKKIIFNLLEVILSEIEFKSENSKEFILEIFGAIILIVSRNLNAKNKNIVKCNVGQTEKEKINKILTHIRQNFNEKEKITQKYISNKFFISQNYLSAYLKKHTGMGLQKMIIETKLKTAEHLLEKSIFTVSQIADKLGFTDSSHMNKIFKKYRGMNPIDFRK